MGALPGAKNEAKLRKYHVVLARGQRSRLRGMLKNKHNGDLNCQRENDAYLPQLQTPPMLLWQHPFSEDVQKICFL